MPHIVSFEESSGKKASILLNALDFNNKVIRDI